MSQFGVDYRAESQPNPVEALSRRDQDNTSVARKAMALTY